MKRIIVGTAGHIDHGKTSLVKALTGIDADRLKEEKERGITIDIGFADMVMGDTHFGFVDVPGHERFVRNMLAGAHGIDIVMLVVAADEGVMPQTREHFDICRLLEIKSGLIVLTKVDLMDDEELLQLVESDLAEFVQGSFLEGAPIIRTSARAGQSGQGIDELKMALAKLAAKVTERDEKAVARLPIDRVFTIKGFGTVVTGTLIAGRVRAGDELDLLPSGARSGDRRARARGLQVFGRSVQEARAGERTAINLQGVEVAEIERGQVLAPSGRLHGGSMLDVRLHVLKTAPRPLRNRSRTHLHLGTAEALARVVILGASELVPGAAGFAQLRLESPILALPGDHFIIRSYSPAATIGGGIVIDSSPHKHRLREGELVGSQLARLAAADETERIALFLEMAGERGMSQVEIAARSGSTDEAIKRAVEALEKSRRIVVADRNPALFIVRPAFEGLAKRATALLKEYHRKSALAAGMAREELRERLFAHLPPEIFRAVIGYLSDRKEIAAEKDLLRLSTHRVALTPEEEAAKEHLAGIYERAGLQPISLEEAIAQSGPQFGIDTGRAQRFAQMLIASGELVRVSDLVFHHSALASLREAVARYKKEKGARIDVGAFKDLTGVSRKYAIPLLEYLDRQRVTRRIGDAREIL